MKEYVAGIVFADGSYQILRQIHAADYTIVNEAILAMVKIPAPITYIIVREFPDGQREDSPSC